MLDKLLNNIADEILLESKYSFIHDRGTANIFSIRQLKEYCIEQMMNLYHVFVDITMALIPHETENLGRPDRLVFLKRSHERKKACVNVSGKLSNSVLVGNCVEQGDMCRLCLHCTLICFFPDDLKRMVTWSLHQLSNSM